MDGLPQLQLPILALWFTGMQKVASGGLFLNLFGTRWIKVYIGCADNVLISSLLLQT